MTTLRRLTGAACALGIGFVFTGSTAAIAAVSGPEPGTESGATVTQTGWWWKSNDNSETPEELRPGTDAVPPPPPPKNVPEGTLPVAAQAGEPDKMSAIQFDLDAEPGALVSSFVVSLRENKDPAANMAADAKETTVAACEVTEGYWTSGEAAAWQARPDYDDVGCAEGVRNANGVWTFDLTTLAMDWLEEGKTSAAIALVEDVDEPTSFQVVYDGPTKDGVGTSLQTTPGGGSPAIGTGSSGTADIDVSSGTAGSDPVPASGGVPAMSSAGIDAMPPAAQAPAAVSGQAPQAPQQPQQPQAVGQPYQIAPSALEAMPAGVWLLAPIVLGMAYLMMLALGPAGEPNAHLTRRGVSKALERLRSTGTKTAEGVR
ncbi:MAG: hypothetical protein GEV04_17495 [Actinophytocola sp.]|nr:hypothetical protein [Actinophytocola sp.]